MYKFFTREDFLTQHLDCSYKTYQVTTSQGVILQASNEYKKVVTTGLRTCVAFALINPAEQSALLIHFFSQYQIKNDLHKLVALFIENIIGSKSELICIIAGGRAFNKSSEEMCEYLINYAKNDLLEIIHQIKLKIHAPIVADDQETLSLLIHLETSQCRMSLVDNDIYSEINFASLDSVDFTDLRKKALSLPYV